MYPTADHRNGGMSRLGEQYWPAPRLRAKRTLNVPLTSDHRTFQNKILIKNVHLTSIMPQGHQRQESQGDSSPVTLNQVQKQGIYLEQVNERATQYNNGDDRIQQFLSGCNNLVLTRHPFPVSDCSLGYFYWITVVTLLDTCTFSTFLGY